MKNRPTAKLLLAALICTLSINGLFGYGFGYPFGKPEATDKETEALNEYIEHNAAINPFYVNHFFADFMTYYLTNNGALPLTEIQRETVNTSRATYHALLSLIKKLKNSEHAHQFYTNLFWKWTASGDHRLAYLLLRLVGPESIMHNKETILHQLTHFGAWEKTISIFIKANNDHAPLEGLVEETLMHGKGLKPLGLFKTNDMEAFEQIQNAENTREIVETLILEDTHPLEGSYTEFIDILKNGPMVKYIWSENKKHMEYAIIMGDDCLMSGWHDSEFSCTIAVLGNDDEISDCLNSEAIVKEITLHN